MADASPKRRARTPERLPLPDEVALVLQGGGALGAYQAGRVRRPAGQGDRGRLGRRHLDRRGQRRDHRRQSAGAAGGAAARLLGASDRGAARAAASAATICGANGCIMPRPEWSPRRACRASSRRAPAPPLLAPAKSAGALSFYDSAPLAATLDALVDWDLLNDGPVRLSVGAVDVETGNFHYFDTRQEQDRRAPHHGLGRAAARPAADRDRRRLVVGRRPRLQHAAQPCARQSEERPAGLPGRSVPGRGAQLPATIMDVYAREKDIRYSSRTRQVTDQLIRLRKEREAIRKVLAKLPAALEEDEDVEALAALAAEHAVNVVHLIYRETWLGGRRRAISNSPATTMEHHWAEGRRRDRRDDDEGQAARPQHRRAARPPPSIWPHDNHPPSPQRKLGSKRRPSEAQIPLDPAFAGMTEEWKRTDTHVPQRQDRARHRLHLGHRPRHRPRAGGRRRQADPERLRRCRPRSRSAEGRARRRP